MSADNGIYIAKFPDGYRVIHTQAIGNVNYYKEGSPEWKETLDDYFGGVSPIEKLDEAYNIAKQLDLHIMEDDFMPYTEYGINFIGEFDYVPKALFPNEE